MLTPVLMVVGFVVSILVVVALAMFFDLAVGGGRQVVEQRERARRRWSPPIGRERDLFTWARSMGAKLVGDVIGADRSPEAAARVVTELHEGASRAMLPVAKDHQVTREIACPEDGQGLIGVTALEAIGLAAYLRENLSEDEVERIYRRSRDNMDRLAGSESLGNGSSPCSLQGDGCTCRAYSARPLQCRPLHAAVIADQLGVSGLKENSGAESWASHADAVRRGLGDGVVHALETAGLDSSVYELHAALVTALEIQDAAERWMNGEDLFAGCLLQDHGPSESLYSET